MATRVRGAGIQRRGRAVVHSATCKKPRGTGFVHAQKPETPHPKQALIREVTHTANNCRILLQVQNPAWMKYILTKARAPYRALSRLIAP